MALGRARVGPSGRHANTIGDPLPRNGLLANCEKGARRERCIPDAHGNGHPQPPQQEPALAC